MKKVDSYFQLGPQQQNVVQKGFVEINDEIVSLVPIQLNEQFALVFRNALKEKYQGRLPSAARIAKDYNQTVPTRDAVSHETVRKWIRGMAFPRAPLLMRLSEWVKTDLYQVFRTPPPLADSLHKTTSQHNSIDLTVGLDGEDPTKKLIQTILQLSVQQQLVLLAVAMELTKIKID
jgi:hypothetical protein